MDDYLRKFGLSPADLGLDGFLTAAESTGMHTRNDKAQTRTSNRSSAPRQNDFDNTRLKDLPLAMAYVPFQPLEGTYEQDEALKAGTLFPNLDKPFLGRRP